MFRTLTCLLLGICTSATACSSKTTEDSVATPVPEQQSVTLHDADGKQLAELFWVGASPEQCTAMTDVALSIGRQADRLVIVGSDSKPAAGLELVAQAHELTNAKGEKIARVVTDTGPAKRISVVDLQGFALFRLSADNGGSAIVRDKAGIPVHTVSTQGGRLVTKTRDDTILAFVTRSNDAILAGLLTAPELDLPSRLLLACDHWMRTPPTPDSSGSTDVR